MLDTVELIRLSGGRNIALRRIASGTSGRTVVFCHGTPGSGAIDPDPDATEARDITLLAIDRPGYGESDPLPKDEWLTVDRSARDLAEVLVQVASGPVGVAGWSAGGRIALALAALRPDLVDHVVILGTPAPHEEVPWIPAEIEQALEAMRGLPAEAAHRAISEQLAPKIPEAFDSFDTLDLIGASPADADVLDIAGALARVTGMLNVAFHQGTTGMVADIAGFTLQPWGFDPADVTAKTLLLYGTKDPIAANRHAQWWQRNLPDARVEMSPGAGHLAILKLWGRALTHLAPGSKRARA